MGGRKDCIYWVSVGKSLPDLDSEWASAVAII